MHQRDLYIIVDDDSGQGVSCRKSGAYTTVCEHFEKGYNTAMVHQMHFRKGASGVTLIELIVAMGILTILVSGILPLSYMTYKRSKEIATNRIWRLSASAVRTVIRWRRWEIPGRLLRVARFMFTVFRVCSGVGVPSGSRNLPKVLSPVAPKTNRADTLSDIPLGLGEE